MILKNLIVGFLVFLCVFSNILFVKATFDAPSPGVQAICLVISAFASIITLLPAWSIYRMESKEGMAYCGMTFNEKYPK